MDEGLRVDRKGAQYAEECNNKKTEVNFAMTILLGRNTSQGTQH